MHRPAARGTDTARSRAFEVTALATATLRAGDHDTGLAWATKPSRWPTRCGPSGSSTGWPRWPSKRP